MPAPAQKYLARSLRRRIGLAVSLLAYLATTLGYPLPVNAQAPTCQDAPCGCPREQHEHKQCCCFTSEHHEEERPACCPHETEKVLASSKSCCPDKEPVAAKPAPILRWTVSLSALACRGHATEWVSVGAVTTPPPAVHWQPEFPLVARSDSFDLFGTVVASTPPFQPPRS